MAKSDLGRNMSKTIIVAAAEAIACPKCGHGFPPSEGISRQAIERHAEEHERALAAELKAAREALATRDSALEKFRAEELALRRKLLEVEEKNRSRDVEYQRRLDAEIKNIEAKTRTSIGDEFSRREAQLKALGSGPDSDQRTVQTISDLTRKFEQTQGEALEVGVEAMLKAAFPMDEVLPVPKGVNAADLLQLVRSPSGQYGVPCSN